MARQGSACSAGLRGANLTQPSDTQLLYQRTLLLPHIVLFLPLQMSHHSSASILPHNFDAIFNRALNIYKKRTKQDLRSHPLYSRLEACASSDAILTILREQFTEFSQSRNTDVRFTEWLVPTVNVLCVSSDMLGEAAGLVCIKMPSC
jgi:hypothetical protein